MHTNSHASKQERAHDGTQAHALKPAVPENVSELATLKNAEVRAMCRVWSHEMEHATCDRQ